MRKLDNAHNAEIVVVTGSSGSRKTTFVKGVIKKRKRVIIFDAAKHEYGDIARPVHSQRELLELIKSNPKGPLKVAYQPMEGPTAVNFDWWCKLVYAWGNCTAVAEEISDVTSPGKAPDGWGQLLRKGRAYGIKIFPLTQRPAESDKTAIGNATLFHAGRQSRADDRKYMARELNVQPDELLIGDGEFIEFNPAKMEYRRGKT